MTSPKKSTTPTDHCNDLTIPKVKWGSTDVIFASIVTILISISIAAIDGAMGSDYGLGTSISSHSGYIIGILSAGIALILFKVFRSPAWPVFIAFVTGLGIVAISYMFSTESSDGSLQFIGLPIGIIVATAISLMFAATGFTLSVIKFREPINTLGLIRTHGARPYAYAALIWILALSMLILWIQIVVSLDVGFLIPPDTAQQVLDEAAGNIVTTVILVGIIGPIAEEIFFRGYVLPGLINRFGIVGALVISSLIFGFFHIEPGAIVPTFVLGLALGWVYLKTGSIWPAVFAHGLHNTFAVLLAKYADVA
ncbi:MAG: CPBP family intramembrane metalloprotease [SAR202 cluster bacterium]|nr:hypothetical protein [Chloroflexota bacterium]MQG87616.1 CPBP family intramembrane metalloprotease [SAR202 cluster bacterium]